MKGRKPYPFQVINATNDKNRFAAATLKAREQNQPKIDSASLWCPSHLSDDAKKEWHRIVRLYKQLKDPIINNLDMNVLEVYCEAVVTYRKAMEEVAKTTEVYVALTGAKINPWLTVANNAALLMKRYGESLLLDPISRARAGMAKSNEKPDPDEQRMNELASRRAART